MSSEVIECPDCGSAMILRETSRFKHRNGDNRKFYGCSTFPVCRCIRPSHPNGQVFGIPGDAETKKARIAAHAIFDPIWQSGNMTRRQAYQWLADKLGVKEIHMSELSASECKRVIQVIEESHG